MIQFQIDNDEQEHEPEAVQAFLMWWAHYMGEFGYPDPVLTVRLTTDYKDPELVHPEYGAPLFSHQQLECGSFTELIYKNGDDPYGISSEVIGWGMG